MCPHTIDLFRNSCLRASLYTNLTRTCAQEGCTLRPRFGERGDKCPNACGLHKMRHYVELGRRLCRTPGCKTRAGFGLLVRDGGGVVTLVTTMIMIHAYITSIITHAYVCVLCVCLCAVENSAGVGGTLVVGCGSNTACIARWHIRRSIPICLEQTGYTRRFQTFCSNHRIRYCIS